MRPEFRRLQPLYAPICKSFLLFFLAIGVPLGAQPSYLQVRQLSPEGAPTTDVEAEAGLRKISPDGKWIVFYADVETDGVPEIYSVSRFGGVPVRLTAVRPPGSDTPLEFLITPDSQHVISRMDQETLGRREVWSVPIEGPATATVKLNPTSPLAAEVSGTAILSGDGQHVAFSFYESGGPPEVWSARVDGSAPAVKLTPAIPVGAAGIWGWTIGPDRVVFAGDLATPARDELWSVPIDGSSAAVRISGSMIGNGDVDTYSVSNDGQRVLYLADQRFDEVYELYSVPVDGPFSAAVRVSPDFAAGVDVFQSQVSVDGTRAIFTADSTLDGQEELWSAPIEGPATAAVKLNGPLAPGGEVIWSVSDLDGSLVYLADQTVDERLELYLVPIEGPSTAGIPVSGSIVAGGDVSYGGFVSTTNVPIDPVVFALGDLRVNGKHELFTTPLAGAPPATLEPIFADPPAGQGYVPDCFGGFSGQILAFCAEVATAGVVRLYRAPLDGSAEPELLSTGADHLESDVTYAKVDPHGVWAALRWDRNVNNRHDLLRVPMDGSSAPVRIHAVPVPGAADVPPGDSFDFTPDGYGIVYLADHDVDEKLDFWISDQMIFRADFEWGDTSEWSAVEN